MNNEDQKKIMEFAIKLVYLPITKDTSIDGVVNAICNIYQKRYSRDAVKFVIMNCLKMHESFLQAVYDAGGADWDWKELMEFTYLDLLQHLATNGIRFQFVKPPKITKDNDPVAYQKIRIQARARSKKQYANKTK